MTAAAASVIFMYDDRKSAQRAFYRIWQ